MMSENARGLAIFRHRDFRYYSASRFLWGMALQIQTIAVAWFIYEQTRDALALGFIGLAMFLPSVPLSLVTGAAADRYDRKKIFSIGYGLTAVCAAALCVLAWQGLIWPICPRGCAHGMFRPCPEGAKLALSWGQPSRLKAARRPIERSLQGFYA